MGILIVPVLRAILLMSFSGGRRVAPCLGERRGFDAHATLAG
jgi:hypothetical protein